MSKFLLFHLRMFCEEKRGPTLLNSWNLWVEERGRNAFPRSPSSASAPDQWPDITDSTIPAQLPSLRDNCLMQPFICTSVQQMIWASLAQLLNLRCCLRSAGSRHAKGRSHGREQLWLPCQQHTHLGLVRIHLGTSLLQLSKRTGSRTFLITQKNIQPDSLWL